MTDPNRRPVTYEAINMKTGEAAVGGRRGVAEWVMNELQHGEWYDFRIRRSVDYGRREAQERTAEGDGF